jgi:hypothetical protein
MKIQIMIQIRVALFLFSCVLFSGQAAFAACYAVGTTSAGDGSGSSWANRMKNLPTQLVRGDTYYLADGQYGSYSFDTPNSGGTTITIKKAQSYDYGRGSDGCSNDISAGWNASSMGSGQAVWDEFYGGIDTPQPGYLILDGNGRAAAPGIPGCGSSPSTRTSASDCGLKIVASQGQDSDFDIGQNNNDGQHRTPNWTIRYFEVQGGGDANSGTQSEEEIRCRGACDNFLVDHVYFHDTGSDFFKIPWTTSFIVQNSYIKQNTSNAVAHGQLWFTEVAASGVDFHSNVIQDIQGTGIWVCLTGCQASNWNIYNNVIWRPQGDTRPGVADGIFSCVNAGARCTGFKFIGNSVVNYATDYSGHMAVQCTSDSSGISVTWKNNLIYLADPSDAIGFNMCGGTLTESNNTYLNNSPQGGISGTDIVVASGAPNPFVNWTGLNFRLASQTTNVSGGATLAAPFNVDAAGSPHPGSDGVWDRGAYQFTSGSAPPPTPGVPTNLTGTVH